MFERGSKPRDTPPWLFGLTNLPCGMFWGFASAALPYMLTQRGMAVDAVATILAISGLPTFIYFFWAPAVDLWGNPRLWLFAGATATGVCVLAIFAQSAAREISILTALLTLASGFIMVVSTANGALLSTALRPHRRGEAAGWLQAANVGGMVIGGGLTLKLNNGHPKMVPYMLSLAIVLSSGFVFLMRSCDEPSRSERTSFRVILRDLWTVAKSPRGQIGILFLVSPVCSSAAANLLSALAKDYGARPAIVTWVDGTGAGIFAAIGALISGQLCKRVQPVFIYLYAGVATGLCSAAIWFAPITATVYAPAVIAYYFVTGLCNTAFVVFAIAVLAGRSTIAGSGYALLLSSGNLSIAYMTWVEGRAYRFGGPHGLFLADCLSNLGGTLVLYWIVRRWPDRCPMSPLDGRGSDLLHPGR